MTTYLSHTSCASLEHRSHYAPTMTTSSAMDTIAIEESNVPFDEAFPARHPLRTRDFDTTFTFKKNDRVLAPMVRISRPVRCCSEVYNESKIIHFNVIFPIVMGFFFKSCDLFRFRLGNSTPLVNNLSDLFRYTSLFNVFFWYWICIVLYFKVVCDIFLSEYFAIRGNNSAVFSTTANYTLLGTLPYRLVAQDYGCDVAYTEEVGSFSYFLGSLETISQLYSVCPAPFTSLIRLFPFVWRLARDLSMKGLQLWISWPQTRLGMCVLLLIC